MKRSVWGVVDKIYKLEGNFDVGIGGRMGFIWYLRLWKIGIVGGNESFKRVFEFIKNRVFRKTRVRGWHFVCGW